MASQVALFRQEAIEFQRSSRHFGDIAVLQPLSTKLFVWFLVTTFGVIAIFLCLGDYARKETVPGYLAPISGTAKVFPTTPGVVTGVHVIEGEQVHKGQLLLTIGTDQIAADGRDVNSTMIKTLNLQRNLLFEQIAAEERRARSERERLVNQIQSIRSEIVETSDQIETQRERIQLSTQLVSSVGGLIKKGYMSAVEYIRRQENVLEQKQALNSLNRQLSDLTNKLRESQYSLEQLPTAMAERIQPLRNDLSGAEQRITEINGRRAYTVLSPISGRVSILQAKVGQVAAAHQLQMEIVPQDDVLQAELFVPTRAAGFIKKGQNVRILYDAFPYQNFGTFEGTITGLSKTIVAPSETIAPIPLKEPAYRVTAKLERYEVEAHGERLPLEADMQLRADIILDRRPLVSWLIEPMMDARY